MLKEIPKSAKNVRPFKVFKQWSFTESDVDQRTVRDSQLGAFDPDQNTDQTPLWRSIRKQYYSDNDAVGVDVLGPINTRVNTLERIISNEIKVINIPPSVFGEEIKPLSVTFTDPNDPGVVISDDGYGNLFRADSDFVSLIDIDFQNETFTALNANQQNVQVLGSVIEFDAENGFITLEVNGDIGTFDVLIIDLQEGYIQLTTQAVLGGITFGASPIGNVFYSQGLIVITKTTGPDTYDFNEFNLEFKSTVTIYEHEFLLTVESGEFNTSTNPTAIEYVGDKPQQQTLELLPSGKTVTYKQRSNEGYPIKKQEFISAVDPSVSGSFDDYEEFKLTDPTGSYLTPYITTIGLYDDELNMVAIGKVARPVKSLPDYPINFMVRLDT